MNTSTTVAPPRFLKNQQTHLFGDVMKLHKLPKTQYLGSKERLVDWIIAHAPRNIETVFDAFSGTSVVGYAFKAKGKRVIGNDFLKFNYHIGKAVIENSYQKLNEMDLQILLHKSGTPGTLIEDVFTGVFFERSESRFLDNFRANVDLLENETKRSLALTIMSRALTRKVLLGHFAHLSALRYSKDPLRIKRNPTIARPLRDLFLELVGEYNSAVFDNRKVNTFYCEDTVKLVSTLTDVDLAYFDLKVTYFPEGYMLVKRKALGIPTEIQLLKRFAKIKSIEYDKTQKDKSLASELLTRISERMELLYTKVNTYLDQFDIKDVSNLEIEFDWIDGKKYNTIADIIFVIRK
jgi:hypothetical protein